jgi:hypothetical protein
MSGILEHLQKRFIQCNQSIGSNGSTFVVPSSSQPTVMQRKDKMKIIVSGESTLVLDKLVISMLVCD